MDLYGFSVLEMSTLSITQTAWGQYVDFSRLFCALCLSGYSLCIMMYVGSCLVDIQYVIYQ